MQTKNSCVALTEMGLEPTNGELGLLFFGAKPVVIGGCIKPIDSFGKIKPRRSIVDVRSSRTRACSQLRQ